MVEPWSALPRRVATVLLAANVLAFAACSGGTGSSAMAPTIEPREKSASVTYITVDDPACTSTTVPCANEIAGINDSRDIVGNYTTCTTKSANPCSAAHWQCSPITGGQPCEPCPIYGGANIWQSYTSTYNAGYSSFANIQYPDAPQGQYMYAISDRTISLASPIRSNAGASQPPAIEVGCINPFAGRGTGGEENSFWALFNNNGLWSVHDQGPATGCGHDDTQEILGYDLTNTRTPTAVGFYSSNTTTIHGGVSCSFIAGEVQAGGNWNALTVKLGSAFSAENVMATGITGSGTTRTGDIVGIATASGKTSSQVGYQVAWYSGFPKTTFPPSGTTASGATAAAFTGIAVVNGVTKIVGWYTLPGVGGASPTTHGLVATPLQTAGKYSVSTIDIGAGLTMINGINSYGDICGWYTDSSGKYHGFVWLGKAASALRKRNRHPSVTRRILSSL